MLVTKLDPISEQRFWFRFIASKMLPLMGVWKLMSLLHVACVPGT